MTLAPRLTAYPEFVLRPERWIDQTLHFPVLDRSDAEGLGRDDPGAIWPERHRPRRTSAPAPRSSSRSTLHGLVLGRRRRPGAPAPGRPRRPVPSPRSSRACGWARSRARPSW